ncbi:MAG: DUF523 and DUF1722 domain-containing protein [Candidatus Omnitrophota bacterium]
MIKPRLFASKCLGFAACRWDGVTIRDAFVESLKPYVEYVTTCPEVEAGLGVPRDPIRIVSQSGEFHLVQPSTGKDMSSEMKSFAGHFLGSLGDIDGFILKDRSPSCGIDSVKVYPKIGPSASVARASGFFGAAVLERFGDMPIETEGRLTNYRIREHFLTRIFTFAGFRGVKEAGRMGALVDFHARNKLLIMSYSQKGLSILGSLTANRDGLKQDKVFDEYEKCLHNTMARISRYTANINILTHSLGYFKDKLSADEKKFFLALVTEYRDGKVPLSVPVNVAKSYIVRFGEAYLARQTFFEPYPPGLVSITDSGAGR